MPNLNQLTQMLKDFQRLIPAAVSVIVAIATAIGVIAGGLDGGSSGNPGANDSQGGATQPGTTGSKYLTDDPSNHHDRKVKSGVGVTVNGKEYEKSILSTDGQGRSQFSFKEYRVAETARTLNLKAAWVDTIPNSGGIGKVRITRDGQLLGEFSVKNGEIVARNFDVRGGGMVRITFSAYDPSNDQTRVPSSGLAVLTPVLK
ncbi:MULTISPECIES: hypothetical protein [unclassified Corynebacterium]|uniref:hypothetical protein n=1 Tax=unclassified Corynebacterium TaxID=2624378 RepID=UPI0008A44225|nr:MULTISPECIES: hypothetical protein [unclassified Corynebacterium]OFQ36685.1 hypothetical protein HMPREF2943_09130 [Corynebacterium sp. HMSC072D12]OFS41385.1 hypothetical protein HMPREF2896_01025 [Corynebacterium sp. HMSC069E04]